MDSTILESSELSKSFGGLQAVDKLSFTLQEGQIVALIGPNGAGKSTVLNMISGFHVPTSGLLRFKGRGINGEPPYKVAGLGIGRTFQNVHVFGQMTVLENVMVGRHVRSGAGLVGGALRLPGQRREEKRIWEESVQRLEWVGLADRAGDLCADLPFGQQRRLELARALALEPSLLLLDESASGLSASEKQEMVQLIYRVRDSGVTVFLVEHDMEMVMGIADWIIVLNYGEKIAEGTPNEIQNNDVVIAAYLGEEV